MVPTPVDPEEEIRDIIAQEDFETQFWNRTFFMISLPNKTSDKWNNIYLRKK